MAVLAFSPYVAPRVYQGKQSINPSNSTPGLDRVSTLRNFAAHLAHLDHVPAHEKQWFLSQMTELASLDGDPDAVHFDPARLTVRLLDGRKRKLVAAIGTGLATPAFSRMLAQLSSGTATRADVERAGLRAGLEAGAILDGLEANGVFGEPAPPHHGFGSSGVRLTWLGHAFCILQTSRTTIWIDPTSSPRVDWTEDDRKVFMAPDIAEHVLYQTYPEHLVLSQLPRPDAVFITHQDVDHYELSTLACVPNSVPIYVPYARKAKWVVNQAKHLREALGHRARILRHGEHAQVGDLRITAFPFLGEMPPSMRHDWNCYLACTKKQAVAFMADSAFDDAQATWLAKAAGKRELTVLGNRVLRPEEERMEGWREMPSVSSNIGRLWGWYASLVEKFEPLRELGSPEHSLRLLAKKAYAFRNYFVYALGCTPWARMGFQYYPHLGMPVNSMSREQLDTYKAAVTAIPRLQWLNARYARAVSLE